MEHETIKIKHTWPLLQLVCEGNYEVMQVFPIFKRKKKAWAVLTILKTSCTFTLFAFPKTKMWGEKQHKETCNA